MNRRQLKALGFKKHDGGPRTVLPDQYVELLIHTSEGLGSSGVCRADLHEWEDDQHEGGLGRVRFYRLAKKDDDGTVEPRHRFDEPA